jgi:hypothetical protein
MVFLLKFTYGLGIKAMFGQPPSGFGFTLLYRMSHKMWLLLAPYLICKERKKF